MANGLQRKARELSENEQAAVGFIKFFAFLIVVGVVIYSEYMFLGIIGGILPDGISKVAAVIGAVATGASVLCLIGAKLFWVTPGAQIIFSWLFMGIEVAIMFMNDTLAYALHNGHVTGVFASWLQITPASPVFALVGWVIILLLDRSQRERHRDMEMEAKIAKSERKYIEAAHAAEMELRNKHLDQVTSRLQDVMASDAIQQQIMAHAERMVARVLTDVSGISANVPMNGTTPRIVSSQPMQLAQTAQTSETPVQADEQPNGLLQGLMNLFNPAQKDVPTTISEPQTDPLQAAPLDHQAN